MGFVKQTWLTLSTFSRKKEFYSTKLRKVNYLLGRDKPSSGLVFPSLTCGSMCGEEAIKNFYCFLNETASMFPLRRSRAAWSLRSQGRGCRIVGGAQGVGGRHGVNHVLALREKLPKRGCDLHLLLFTIMIIYLPVEIRIDMFLIC